VGWALLVFSIFRFDWWNRPNSILDALPGSDLLPAGVQDELFGGPDPLSLIDGAPAIGWIELALALFAVWALAISFGRRATKKVPARAVLVAVTCTCGLALGVGALFVSPGRGDWSIGSAWIGMLIGWALILASLGIVYFTWDSELEPVET
jgi:hypothetical protein